MDLFLEIEDDDDDDDKGANEDPWSTKSEETPRRKREGDNLIIFAFSMLLVLVRWRHKDC
jgi:hypothetical protein